jgi:hypothetical protein
VSRPIAIDEDRRETMRRATITATAFFATLGLGFTANAQATTSTVTATSANDIVLAAAGRRIDQPRLAELERNIQSASVTLEPRIHVGRRTDALQPARATERAEFAAFDEEAADMERTRASGAWSGRRIDNGLR